MLKALWVPGNRNAAGVHTQHKATRPAVLGRKRQTPMSQNLPQHFTKPPYPLLKANRPESVQGHILAVFPSINVNWARVSCLKSIVNVQLSIRNPLHRPWIIGHCLPKPHCHFSHNSFAIPPNSTMRHHWISGQGCPGRSRRWLRHWNILGHFSPFM